jgi:hypothetical protein
MTTLHAIADEVLAALETGEDGELTADAEARLDALQLDLAAKLDAVCRYGEQLRATAQMREQAAKRLTELAHADRAKDGRLKRYVLDTLQRLGVQRYDTDLYRLSVCKTSQPAVKLDDELTADKLPLMYQRINVELNREQVLQDYRAGLPLPAGVSVEQSFHLRVK